jgi:hypothetical protein
MSLSYQRLHLDTLHSPNLEGHVPIFISSRKRVAQLHPQALGSLSATSYDSQGYGGGIRTSLYAAVTLRLEFYRISVHLRVKPHEFHGHFFFFW